MWDQSSLYATGTIDVMNSSAGGGSDGPIPPWVLGALGAGLIGIASRRIKITDSRCPEAVVATDADG